MYSIVTENAFIDAFKRSDERKDSFTYHGLTALFDHLIQEEEQNGESNELDICEIDSTYTEYASIADFKKDFKYLDWVQELDEEDEQESLQTIQKNTTVFLEYPQGFILANAF